MIVVSVCLPSDALSQCLPSYLGFSYLGRGESLHGCSSKAQPLLLTLYEVAPPDLGRGVDPDNHDGVITDLEPDILECEVKWALGSITVNKASGGDGIPGELFQILKDDAVKVLLSICQQIWKIQQWTQDWKMSVFTPIPKKGNAKECSNYHTIALISHASKVMLKILQARPQQYMNHELPDVQAGFRKGRGTRDQIANIMLDHQKSKRVSRKISISALLTMPKPLTVGITINCGKF